MLVADIVGADPMLVIRRIKDALFSQSPQELRGARGFITKIGQVIYLTVAKFRKDFCLERAASLTFFSIISLIPLTVLFFSIARSMNQGEVIKDWFLDKIPGLVAPGLTEEIRTWLDNYIGTNALVPDVDTELVNITAVCGLVIISLGIFIAAERVFNHIWQVHRQRNYLQRLVVFWVILTTSPLLAMASLSVDAALDAANIEILRSMEDSAAFAMVFGFLAFSMMYFFLPAVKVGLGSAVMGGLVAALLWQLSKYGFSYYLERITNVTTFYSQIAAVPLFLIWLYVTWMVVLIGGQVSFVHQNRTSLARLSRENAGDGKRSLPALGFYILYRVGSAFRNGGEIPSLREVTQDLGMARGEGVERAAEILLEQGILLGDGARDSRHTLACDPARVNLSEVAGALRTEEFPGESSAAEASKGVKEADIVIRRLIGEANTAWEGSFEARTLADILPVEGTSKGDQVVVIKQDMQSD
ncbi:MAG: YihY/virulence factor BrkB family protein [Planctomycetota bacterium]